MRTPIATMALAHSRIVDLVKTAGSAGIPQASITHQINSELGISKPAIYSIVNSLLRNNSFRNDGGTSRNRILVWNGPVPTPTLTKSAPAEFQELRLHYEPEKQELTFTLGGVRIILSVGER